jgi:hypothetical protein
MAAHDMTDTMKYPHPEVTFYTIWDETVTALTKAIFKDKLKKPLAPVIKDSPSKAVENKCPAVFIQPVITSPAKHNYQKI